MLYQMVYSSRANEVMPKSKLYQILREARLANAKRDVTGVLMFADGLFLQVLEGEEATLRALMTKIAADKRHKDIAILSEGTVPARAFPSWQMAYVTSSAREMAIWAGLRSTTTIENTMAHLSNAPGNVAGVLAKLVGALSEPGRSE